MFCQSAALLQLLVFILHVSDNVNLAATKRQILFVLAKHLVIRHFTRILENYMLIFLFSSSWFVRIVSAKDVNKGLFYPLFSEVILLNMFLSNVRKKNHQDTYWELFCILNFLLDLFGIFAFSERKKKFRSLNLSL